MKLLALSFLSAVSLAASTTSPWTLYCSNTSCTDRSNAILSGSGETTEPIPCFDFPQPYKYCVIEWTGTEGTFIEGQLYPNKGCTGTDEDDLVPIYNENCSDEWAWRPQTTPFQSFKGVIY